MVVTVTVAPHTAPVLQDLLLGLWSDLDAIYGPNPGTEFRPEDLAEATYFVAHDEQARPVGCAALTAFPEPHVLEVKRMYVVASARGQGVGRALMQALYEHAAAQQVGRLCLETGVHQPAAVALYRAEGFVPVSPWPPHDTDPLSLCFTKSLRGPTS